MAYNINKTNGDLLVVVEDGTADLNSTSLALIGRNFSGFGEYFNENFIKLLENFANSTQPSAPLVGQLWYDSATQLLKVYNGEDFISSGGGIVLEQTSTLPHYLTFVEITDGSSGLLETRVAGTKGMVFQPSTGFLALNKSTPATSRLEINGSSNAARPLMPTLDGTLIHVHGEAAGPARITLDSYGGATTNSAGIVMRRTYASGDTSGLPLGSVFGSVSGRGWNGTGFSNESASIRFVASQSWTSTGGNGSRIEFYTTTDFSTTPVVKTIIHQNGDLEVKGDIIAFSLSAERLKTNLAPIDNALDKLSQLHGMTFQWVADRGSASDKRDVGVIAQQLQKVLPEAVAERSDGYLGVRYEKIAALLIEAVKELKAEVDALKSVNPV